MTAIEINLQGLQSSFVPIVLDVLRHVRRCALPCRPWLPPMQEYFP